MPNVNAPQVAIQDRDVANFAETEAGKQARQEMAEFDHLFNGLSKESADFYRQRVKEVVEAAVPIRKET